MTNGKKNTLLVLLFLYHDTRTPIPSPSPLLVALDSILAFFKKRTSDTARLRDVGESMNV